MKNLPDMLKRNTKFVYTKYKYENKIFLIKFRGLSWFNFETNIFLMSLFNFILFALTGSTISLITAFFLMIISLIAENTSRKTMSTTESSKYHKNFDIGDIVHFNDLGHFMILTKTKVKNGMEFSVIHLESENSPYKIFYGMDAFKNYINSSISDNAEE